MTGKRIPDDLLFEVRDWLEGFSDERHEGGISGWAFRLLDAIYDDEEYREVFDAEECAEP